MNKKIIILSFPRISILLLVIMATACKKFVEIDPPVSQITAPSVYSNNTSAAAVMSGLYSTMNTNPGLSSGNVSIGYLEGLASDELKNFSSDPMLTQFYTNALTSASGASSNNYYWPEIYNEIHIANAVIEGLLNSKSANLSMFPQLMGEAKFMRAFLHFYAVNLYGDVPLITTTDYLANNKIARSPVSLIYQQIVQDLNDAKNNLSDNYLDQFGAETSARVRPNKGAAEALLARAYLYMGNKWDSAEIAATDVINNNVGYTIDSNLTQVFTGINNQEAIWQLLPVSPGYNTFDGYYYVLTSTPGTGQFSVGLSDSLVNAFETDDKRLANWVGTLTDNTTNYNYPNKYKIGVSDPGIPVTEYVMVLRLAEQYLIRAEARAQQGNIAGAQADLNVIRQRAGLPNTTANTKEDLLFAIAHERRVELFTEWGHRWFDLKRTNTLNAVMGTGGVCAAKGGTWSPDWALIPIPLGELQLNPKLTQNQGY